MSTGIQEQPQRREAYKFTAEEMRILKECNRDSFYFRSLPFGTVFGAVTYYCIKSGFLKGHPKWGALPKMAAAVTAGYFMGKISYRNKCEEKFLGLTDSPLAEAIRQRRGKSRPQDSFIGDALTIPASSISDDEQSDSLIQEMRAQDFSYGAPPSAVGLDDSFRPSMDSFEVAQQPLPPVSQNMTSYDDLRRQNREGFQQRRLESYQAPPPTSSDVPRPVPNQGRPTPKVKNSYGDVWEE